MEEGFELKARWESQFRQSEAPYSEHASSIQSKNNQNHEQKEVSLPESKSTQNQDEEKHDRAANTGSNSAAIPPPNYITGTKLVLTVSALAVTIFCVAVDNTILATTIPRLTDEFHTINDIGWWGSTYLLTNLSFQVVYAKFYQYCPVKWVFLIALAIFEVGSVISASAPTSATLIAGRAIAGVGGAGLLIGSNTASAQIAPLHLRPTIMGLMGSLFAISNVVSPLLGGAFTEKVTWRWCFYINLPLGAVAAIGVYFLLDVRRPIRKFNGGLLSRVMQFDPIGNICFIASISCLLLALQLGATKTYSNGGVIACLVIFGTFFIVWIVIQIILKEEATIPPRIHSLRTIRFGALFGFCMGSSVFVMTYYLPTWFQAVKGKSPILSAVCMLPTIIAQTIATIGSGILTTRLGHYMPYVYGSSILVPIGIGLMTTFTVDTTMGQWIGYQIIFGLGFGMGFQQIRVAASAVLPLKDLSLGIAALFAVQYFGGTVFIAASQSVFAERLQSNLGRLSIPNLNAQSILAAGVTDIKMLVPPEYQRQLLEAYNDAIIRAFLIPLIMSCVMVIGALGMEWKSVRPKKPSDQPVKPTP